MVTVNRIEKTGTLVVRDEQGETKTLAPSQRLLVHGYAVTSYASQGKTADMVIVADAGNPAATSREQWYVSISRGRKCVVVLTPDRIALRKNIQRTSSRELALEEMRERVRVEEERQAWHMRQQQFRELAIRHEWTMRQQEDQGVRQRL